LELTIGFPKEPPWRRVLRGVVWVFVLLVLLYGSLSFLFGRITRIVPPAGTAVVHTLQHDGRKSVFGPNSLTLQGAQRGPGHVWVLRLKGAPRDIGYAHGALGNRLFMAVDDHMFAMMEHFVPSAWNRWLILTGVRWKYRSLADLASPDHKAELAGLASSLLDTHARFVPTYQRLVYYHATHEITQGLEHSPLLGCSVLAVAGPASSGGHLLIGRNFDFEGGEIFDKEKAVLFVHPDGKIPFASVSWIGFAGVVTGINARGIFISVNAARSEDTQAVGVPVALLARQVLEEASTLDEAIAILKRARTIVANVYLVGDGKSQTVAVVEKSPGRMAVRRAKDTIFATNHFVAQEFVKDGENDRLRRYTTSGYRHQRLGELLQGARGWDARRVLAVLRDRKGLGGKELGLGNRNAIDALIATHSVVVDATEMVLYVST